MIRFASSYPEHQVSEDWIALHTSATETVDGDGTLEVRLPENCRGLMMQMAVIGGSLVGDLFDLYVQTQIHLGGGDVWVDVLRFTQIAGTDPSIAYIDKLVAGLDQPTFNNATGLAAGAKRHLMGANWRCRWEITDGGGIHSFLFDMYIQPMNG